MTWVALATYRAATGLAPALAVDHQPYALEAAVRAGLAGVEPTWLSGGVGAMVRDWSRVGPWLTRAGPALAELAARGKVTPVAASALAAPYVPDKIFCAASNFIEHANEMGTVLAAKSESKPYMFLKLANTVIGPGEAIRMPPETTMLDWEIELAAVIGTRCRRIKVEDALSVVAGYTIVNDVSARDLNMRSDYPFKFDWFQGKCHDTFAPLGPWIVPASQIPDPQAVHLKLDVNTTTMQDDTAANMIWTVREQIAYLSTIVTLEPGDVIATGTPTGVGMGRNVYLKHGDLVTATIDGIGTIANRVEAEKLA
ncbi:MAG: fumarylacetoacetate hydrolase family protein [Burkholderiales bacterium]|nr:fumarylacetoacetate hydrolase family protein [Burkholderiales bacterium]